MAIINSDAISFESDIHKTYAEWILIFFKIYFRIGQTPFLVKYDEKSGFYKVTRGSRNTKLGFVICHSLIAIYTVWGLTISTMHENSPSNLMNGLYKLSYFLFGYYNVIWCFAMWTQVHKIPSLLNKGNEMFNTLLQEVAEDGPQDFDNPTKTKSIIYKLAKFMRWPCMVLIVIFTIISTLSFYTQGIIEDERASSGVLVNHVMNLTIASFCRVHQFWCTLLMEPGSDQPKQAAYVFTSVWVLITLLAEFSWQTVFFMMTAWALYFRTMLKLGIKRINNSTTNADMFKAVQLFSRIGMLLDEWNETFGLVLLVNFVNILIFKCVSFANIMASKMGMLYAIWSSFNIIPHFVMLYYMADAHRVGCSVTKIWKQKYIIQKRFEEPLPLDIFHSSCIFHHDILTSSIAFKGLGFFVVSFQFVGNLIGIMTTYTLVTVQLTTVR